MADLKPRQYKRLGRIEERNPERAARVAGRMEKRATREERGKAVAKSASEGNKGIRTMTKEAFGTRSESLKREAIQKFRGKGEAMSKQDFEKRKATLRSQSADKMVNKPVSVVRGKINRPDTPLAMTPEPFGSFKK
jgi:hypothetical protein